jgi:tetratricopeptide (TPR) repeat protein
LALKTHRIFLSSPGDVAQERLIARRVIGRLDAQFGEALQLECIFWEHQPLVATAGFQEQLIRPSETDVVIVILWSRLGTPLPAHIRRGDERRYASGTEFEFEDAMAEYRRSGRPHILAYLKTAPPAWPADTTLMAAAVAQKQALDRFVQTWFQNPEDGSARAAAHNFESPADFEELLEAHLRKLVELALPPNALSAAVPTWREGSPFRGLHPFEREHAAVFFGRTAAIAVALDKLRRQMQRDCWFLLVVGMSGSGKSSLVRAGVLPLIQQPDLLREGTEWIAADMRPSDARTRPVEAIARSITRALGQEDVPPGLDEPATIGSTLGNLLGVRNDAGRERSLVLLVDQFEELFSDERVTPEGRESFIACLDALARSGRACVIATLRSDRYPLLGGYPDVIALKEGDGQLDLLLPSPREIAQMIRLPAAAAGLRFEVRPHTAERLDDVIREAAVRNIAALPLLQFLLEELYQRRSNDNVLTFKAYEELGGVEGALARRAEQIFAELSEAARATLPAVLAELVTVTPDDDARALRRIATVDALDPEATELTAALVRERLLVTGLDEHGRPTIALAHESLLEFWPRLREWREKNRENLRVRARLVAAARTWEREGRSADFLLARGKPLAEARALVTDGVRVTDSELQLLRTSQRRVQRLQWLRAAAVASLAALSVVATIAAWRANVASSRARIQATTAERTTDFMVSMFKLADPEESRGANVTARELLDRGVAEIRDSLAGERAVRANLMRAMGQAYNGLGVYPRAHELLQESATLVSGGGVPKDDEVRTYLALGANRYSDGAYAEATQWFRRAAAEARAEHGERHPMISEALAGTADAIYEQGEHDEAERLYREALAIDLALHGENHPDTARSLNGLGWLLNFESRYDEARAVWERALAVRLALYGNTHAKVAESWNNLGVVQWQKGDFADAARNWNEALAIYRKVYGEDHPNTSTMLNNLGRAELMAGHLDAADAYLTRALTIDRNTLNPDHDDLITPLNSLAMIDLERGNLTRAGERLVDALQIARARKHWMLDQVLTNLADLHVRTGQLKEAEAMLAEAHGALQSQYGAALGGVERWRTAVLDSVEASFQIASGDLRAAQEKLEAALPVLEARFGRRGLFTRQAGARLIVAYERTGRSVAAQSLRTRLATNVR